MKTIWRYRDAEGVLHMTTDIDEADEALKARRFVLGEVLHEDS